MRKNILLLCTFLLMIASCEKDQDVIQSNVVIQKENISSFYKSAIVECELRSSATLSNIFVDYSNINGSDYQRVEVKKIANKYFAVLTGLTPNTSYDFRYYTANKYSNKTIERESRITTTSQTSIAAVLTDTATNITKSSAKVQIYIIDNGGEYITEEVDIKKIDIYNEKLVCLKLSISFDDILEIDYV